MWFVPNNNVQTATLQTGTEAPVPFDRVVSEAVIPMVDENKTQ
jgi:hypothetical protein